MTGADLLLAPRPLRRVRRDGLDRIPDTLNFPGQAVGDDGEVRRQRAVVVDQQGVLELLGGVGADELGDDLRADGAPDVVDAVGAADFLGVVQGFRRVAVGDDEDVRGREGLEGGAEGVADEAGGFVAGDEEGGVADAGEG